MMENHKPLLRKLLILIIALIGIGGSVGATLLVQKGCVTPENGELIIEVTDEVTQVLEENSDDIVDIIAEEPKE